MRSLAARLIGIVLAASAAAACGRGPAEPDASRVTLTAHSGAAMIAGTGSVVSEPLQVLALHADTRQPLAGVDVSWTVLEGPASLSRAASRTDEYGLAAVTLTTGDAGTARIRATVPNLAGTAPLIEVRVVNPPVIQSLDPAIVEPGGEVVITGSGFSPDVQENVALFDGVRGQVLEAAPGRLRVRAPLCLPARSVSVRVGLGLAFSTPAALTSTATEQAPLALEPGRARTFTDPAEFACVRLDGSTADAAWLVVAHNLRDVFAPPLRFELRALAAQAPAAAQSRQSAAVAHAEGWEAELRRRERALRGGPDAVADVAAATRPPEVGDRRDFDVLDVDQRFQKVSAVVRVISRRAVLYVDERAANAFTGADLQRFGEIFDDPVFPTTVAAFGAPSDVDGNQRVLVLFTPAINQLTPRGESSFIAGYFYGCDLLSRSRCSGSNGAEIFYSMVPDPGGQWGEPRSTAAVMGAVPPVLAHEFQHMIHFAQRGMSADRLWLAEALAHTAEELTGDVFAARGDAGTAALFRTANHLRAQRYLTWPGGTSLLEDAAPGSLELRGGAWLFLRYLRGHYGGDDLLRRLTTTTRSGVDNVSFATGQTWSSLLTAFGVALWADGAPGSAGSLDERYRFIGFDLRSALEPLPGGYPLQPRTSVWRDLSVSGLLPPASVDHTLISTPADREQPPLHLVLSGARGAPLEPGAGAALTILRVR